MCLDFEILCFFDSDLKHLWFSPLSSWNKTPHTFSDTRNSEVRPTGSGLLTNCRLKISSRERGWQNPESCFEHKYSLETMMYLIGNRTGHAMLCAKPDRIPNTRQDWPKSSLFSYENPHFVLGFASRNRVTTSPQCRIASFWSLIMFLVFLYS